MVKKYKPACTHEGKPSMLESPDDDGYVPCYDYKALEQQVEEIKRMIPLYKSAVHEPVAKEFIENVEQALNKGGGDE